MDSIRPKSPPRGAILAPPFYSDGVLIGNWVEDRIECPKDLGYGLLFPPKDHDSDKWKPETRLEDFRQNKLNDQQGVGMYRVLQHDSHVRCGNYTTTNDLVYHHLPKPLCGPELRYFKKAEHQWYPQPDLTKCYGNNLTTWGLRASKHYEWACTDVSDYSASTYEDNFIPPFPGSHLRPDERKARNSSFTKSFRFLMTKPLTKTKNIKNHSSAKRKS